MSMWLLCLRFLSAVALLCHADDQSMLRRKEGALVVSSGTTHNEIVAFFCYHLNHIGFDVHTYLGQSGKTFMSGVAYNHIYPFVKSVQFFPSKKKQEALQIPERLKVLVYITMNTKEDLKAMCSYKKIHDTVYNLSEHVIMVNHWANFAPQVHDYCRAPKCAIFHLAEHTHIAAKEFMQSKTALAPFQLAYANAVHEVKWLPQAPEEAATIFEKFKPSTRLLVIQGNMEMKRRRYDDLFVCMRDLRAGGTDVQLVSIGKSMKGFSIPRDITNYVYVLQNLPFPDFYSIVQHADFLLSFLNNENAYDKLRSSASVPTAIMNHVPIVLPQPTLDLYSCLKDSPTMRFIAEESDCASLKKALALPEEKYKKLKEEITVCNEVWLKNASATIEQIVRRDYRHEEIGDFFPQCGK